MRMARTRSSSRSVNGAATSRWTYTRLVALHFWFCRLNAERITPSAAASRSAVGITIAAFLPPSSSRHGLMKPAPRPA